MFEEWLYAKPEWKSFSGRVRIRKDGERVQVAYKETRQETSKGNIEIEFEVSDVKAAQEFLEKMGLTDPRHQQKRRISYKLDGVGIDIDFWPKIPPYVEIEAPTLKEIETVARKVGLDMKNVCNLDALQVIQQVYHVDLSGVKEYIFDK